MSFDSFVPMFFEFFIECPAIKSVIPVALFGFIAGFLFNKIFVRRRFTP